MTSRLHHPINQSVVDSPERKAKRRARRLGQIADAFLAAGKYALVALVTVLVVVPDIRLAALFTGGNVLLLGIAIGCGMRWHS